MHLRKSTKIILLLIALLVVFLVIFVVFSNFSQPQIIQKITLTPDSIPADWKTCRNVEAGYEIKYPKEWYVYGEGGFGAPSVLERITDCVGKVVLLTTQPPSRMRSHQLNDVSITVTFETKSYYSSLGAWPKGIPVTPESIMGIKAERIILIGGQPFELFRLNKLIELVGVNGQNVYKIVPSINLEIQTLEKILYSLKFIN